MTSVFLSADFLEGKAQDEPGTTSLPWGPPAGFEYAQQFCEENIYKLINRFILMGASIDDDMHVVFISSLGKATPIWYQRASLSKSPSASLSQSPSSAGSDAVWWDYHVILQFGADIFDLDTLLPFPTPIAEYVELAFQPQMTLEANNAQRFRVIKAGDYLQRFSSDRSHMAEALASGQCVAMPAWEAIRGCEALSDNEIEAFWDVSVLSVLTAPSEEGGSRGGLGGAGGAGDYLGVVLDRDAFFAWADGKCDDMDDE